MRFDDAGLARDSPLQQIQPAEVRYHVGGAIVFRCAESALEDGSEAVENQTRLRCDCVQIMPWSAHVLDPSHRNVKLSMQGLLVRGLGLENFRQGIHGSGI